MILALAEILRLEEFRQAHNLRAASGSVGHSTQRLLKILFRLRPARHLHQRYAKFLRGHAFPTSANKYSRESAATKRDLGRCIAMEGKGAFQPRIVCDRALHPIDHLL